MSLTNIRKILRVRKVLFEYFKDLRGYGNSLKDITFPIREIDKAQIEIDKIYRDK